MADNRDIVRKHIELFNKGDWNGYKAIFSDDAVYEEEATQKTATGPDQIIKTIQPWKKAFPDLKGTIKNLVATGDAVVAEIMWEGTHNGVLDLPSGQLPATGRHGKVAAVEVLRFENGKVRELRHYFDLMTILVQLGVSTRPSVSPTP